MFEWAEMLRASINVDKVSLITLKKLLQSAMELFQIATA